MSELLKLASCTDAQIEHDWTTAQHIELDPASEYDVVVLGVSKARSANTFGRRIGQKDSKTIPPAIEKHVLLVERFLSGEPGRIYVDGAGLVGPLLRALPETGIGWPEPAESATWADGERQPARMLDTPALLSIRGTGTKKAEVGEYQTYGVTRVRARDVRAFVAESRRAHAQNKADAAPAVPAPAADPIPF